MGQQQLLLIVLGILIVGMAIYGTTHILEYYNAVQTRDRVRQEGLLLCQYAEEYKLRAKQLGGGGGLYDGFKLPKFFIGEPDIGYWVGGWGQFLLVYTCSWGPGAVKGEDSTWPISILIIKSGNDPARVYTLN